MLVHRVFFSGEDSELSEMAAAVIEEIVDEPETIKVGRERSRYVWNPQLDTEHFAEIDPDGIFLPPPYWLKNPHHQLVQIPTILAMPRRTLSSLESVPRNAMPRN